MPAQCDPCAYAIHSDELHCWYNDAQDVEDVARWTINVSEPDGSCIPSAISSDIDTPPATPRNRRGVVAGAGGDALDTPPKRRPPITVRDAAFAIPLLDADTRVNPDEERPSACEGFDAPELRCIGGADSGSYGLDACWQTCPTARAAV